MKGTPDSFNKSGYDVMRFQKVSQDCIASIAPRLTINSHAVLPLVFLQDTCQSTRPRPAVTNSK